MVCSDVGNLYMEVLFAHLYWPKENAGKLVGSSLGMMGCGWFLRQGSEEVERAGAAAPVKR